MFLSGSCRWAQRLPERFPGLSCSGVLTGGELSCCVFKNAFQVPFGGEKNRVTKKGSKYWPPGTGKQEAYTAATAGTLQKNTFHTLHDTYVLGWLRIMWRTLEIKKAGSLHYLPLRYWYTEEQIRGRDPSLGREPLTYPLVPKKYQFPMARF